MDGKWRCEVQSDSGELLYVAYGNDKSIAELRAGEIISMSSRLNQLQQRNRELEDRLKPPPRVTKFKFYATHDGWPLSDADGLNELMSKLEVVTKATFIAALGEDEFHFQMKRYCLPDPDHRPRFYTSSVRDKPVYVFEYKGRFVIFTNGSPL